MNLCGVVVAAGSGRRFGGAKSTALLAGKPLWEWARDALSAGGVELVVVVGDVPGGRPGGERRRDSVLLGLGDLPADATHVLVHDAARPLASADLVRAVADRLAMGDVAGVVPAVVLRDTVKRINGAWVEETVDRTDLVAVQTPQGFVLDTLVAAHHALDGDAFDDAALVERIGGRIAVVPGEPANLKITYPEDLHLLEAMLR
jgi:2-C-methyl-D-erythritol 4-phosphate cytidylyltransferase